MNFDLEVNLKVMHNVVQYPLHHKTYAATKFEVARFNSLGGDIFTRNVTEGQVGNRQNLV